MKTDEENKNVKNNDLKKKRLTLLLIIIVLMLILISVSHYKDSKVLTINKIKEIAKKGNEVSWSDFSKFEGKEIGSGLRIIYYEINGEFDLMIGGGSENEKPMYVRLVLDNNTDKYIDIRTDNIDEFIKENTSNVSKMTE